MRSFALVRVDPGSLAQLLRQKGTDPVDIAKRDHSSLIVGDIYAENTGHTKKTPSNRIRSDFAGGEKKIAGKLSGGAEGL